MSRLVEYADELVTSVGPRPGASKGEHQAAELIAQNLEDMGLDTYIQEFQCARSTGWVRILYYVLAALAAFILFFATDLKILALILALAGAALLVLDLLGKNPLFNLFNKGLSQNVVARYIPDGADSRRKVIVVAHYDSGRSMIQCAPFMASSYTFLRKLIRISVLGLLVVILLSLLPFWPEVLLLVLGILGIVLGVVVLIAALFEVINLFLPFNQGANCNASGVATLYGVAQTLTGSRSGKAQSSSKRRSARPAGSARSAGRQTEDAYGEQDDYLDDEESGTGRRGAGSAAAAAAGVAGAAGSIFQKAKGLVSKKDQTDRDSGSDDYVDDDNLDTLVSSRRGRSSAGSGRGRGSDAGADTTTTLRRGGAGAVSVRGAAQPLSDSAGAGAGIGLGAAAGASKAASTATSIAGNLANHKDEPRQTGAVRSTTNPSIRTRPPLAQQEEQERQIREDAEAARQNAGRTADGVPAWFANAKKKAAQKEASQRSKVPEDHETVRSQFADVPLTSAEIAAKATSKSADKSGRAAAGASTVAKSIFAEPQLQSLRPDDTPAGDDQSAAGAEVEILNATAALDVTAYTADDAGVAVATDTDRTNTGHIAPRSAAELLQQRLSQGTTEQSDGSNAATGDGLQQQGATIQQSAPEQNAPNAQNTPSYQPSSLQMDFSGLDRLAGDANPSTPSASHQIATQNSNIPSQAGLQSRLAELPSTATPLERATATPAPAAPTNDRLRNIPRISLGDSGMIPTQQAAFDTQASPSEQMHQPSDSLVSSTGSFAPLGATGLMQPVGEELLNYHDEPGDIYIEDSDDSDGSWGKGSTTGGAGSAPHIMEIPQSRTKSFFGGLGDRLSGGSKKRGEDLDSSPSTWLGVEEDFDARSAGSEIGSWQNFTEEDDDGWKGGAYGGTDEQNREALQSFSYELIDKEVWVVALGSHENKNAGLKSFLQDHERDLRNALIINIDGVGAGDLCFTVSEGTFRTLSTDHRLQNLAEAAGRYIGADLEPVPFTGYTTDAAAALKAGMRAISILGLDRNLPVGWRWSDDRLDIIEEDNLQTVSDIVVEMIKSS